MSGRRLLVVGIRDCQGRIRVWRWILPILPFQVPTITPENPLILASSSITGSRKFPIIVHELSSRPPSQPLPTIDIHGDFWRRLYCVECRTINRCFGCICKLWLFVFYEIRSGGNEKKFYNIHFPPSANRDLPAICVFPQQLFGGAYEWV